MNKNLQCYKIEHGDFAAVSPLNPFFDVGLHVIVTVTRVKGKAV